MFLHLVVVTFKVDVSRIENGDITGGLIIHFWVDFALEAREAIEVGNGVPGVSICYLGDSERQISLVPVVNSPSSTAVVLSLVSAGGWVVVRAFV